VRDGRGEAELFSRRRECFGRPDQLVLRGHGWEGSRKAEG
jgi:hypothetical protein